MSRPPVRILIAIFLVCLVATSGTFYWGYALFTRPGAADLERTVLIPKGCSLVEITNRLSAAGVIDRPFIFHIGVRLGGWERELKSGEFLFPARTSLYEAAEILRRGVTVVHRVTIPEGLSSYEVLAFLQKTNDLSGNVVKTPPEGTLLPETYYYSHGDQRRDILARMTKAMNTALKTMWETRDKGLPFTDQFEALTLAAIVEKETNLPEERARIAGVFINRLKHGMRLQSDPTVIYGLTKGKPLGRPLKTEDLKKYTPHNTYKIPGLPPGPITNPGIAAIKAVLHPMISNEFYFVANGRGGHAFASSLDQHRQNVKQWRRYKNQQKALQ